MTFWNSLGDYLAFFLWIIVLFTYLMAVFTIVGDLMRDPDLPGWGKGIWVAALIFVPFLTPLLYLIARGRGIAQRQANAVTEARKATDDYIKTVASVSPSDEIAKAKNLLAVGTITQAEFEHLKDRALGGPTQASTVPRQVDAEHARVRR